MLNLSVNEQKQVVGGAYQVLVYNRNGKLVAKRVFGTYQQAARWAQGPANARYTVRINRI